MQYYLRKYHFTLFLVLVLLQGCGSDEQTPTNEKEALVNTLTLERVNPISLDVGETFQNQVTGLSSGNISYLSTNEDVATVDEEGVVTAHKYGNADIVITQEADEEYSQATETYSVKVGFRMSAWIGEESTTLELPNGVEGVQLYRTKNFDCDHLNNSNCNSGLLDYLSEGVLIDESTGLNKPSSYHFVNEDKTSGLNLHFPMKHLMGRVTSSIVSFKDKVWIIGGRGGDSEYSYFRNDDVWSSVDGINWNQELTEAPFGRLSSAESIVFKNKIWIFGGWLQPISSSTERSLKTWSSEDGKNWEQQEANFPYEESVRSMFVFEQKLWVLTKESAANVFNLRSSDNGIDWIRHDHNIPFDKLESNIVEWSGNLIALGQKGTIWTSEDGLSWNNKEIEVTKINTESSIAHYPYGVVHKLNNKLYATSASNSVWISENGFEWKESNPINTSSSFNRMPKGFKLVHNDQIWSIENNKFNTYVVVAISSNGVNWSELSYKNEPSSSYDAVFYKDKFLLLGGYSPKYNSDRAKRIYSSLDGINWKLETENVEFGPRYGFTTFEYLDKLWLAGGKADSGVKNDLWFSDDGISWTKSEYTMPVDSTLDYSNINFIYFDEKLWLFPRYDKSEDRIIHVWSTTNLVDWKKEAEIPLQDGYTDWVDVNVINDQIWLQQGTISNSESGYEINNLWHSSDGKNWSEVNPVLPSFPKLPDDLIFITINGQFFLIGAEGPFLDETFILSSINGYDWDLIDGDLNTKLFDRSYGIKYVIKGNKIFMFGEWLYFKNGPTGHSGRTHPKASVWRTDNLLDWEKGTQIRITPIERR